MDHSLSYDKLSLSVKNLGAELSSLKLEDHEYLWQGDEHSWTGQSPLLFPIVGSPPGGSFTLDGKVLKMGNHGFARKTDFLLKERTVDSLTFILTSTEETRAQYPFDFDLEVSYKIKEASLKVDYLVKNLSPGTMTFSIGGHPGFKCPMEEGLSFNDYFLEFNQKETVERRLKEDNLLSGERESLLEEESTIPLAHDLFDRGALILDSLESTEICLKTPGGKRQVSMDFTGFPYFGIWKMQNTTAPYICLEPWFGIDSTKGDSDKWEEKEGLESLDKGETFTASYTITLE